MLRQKTPLESLMISLTRPLDSAISEKNLISMDDELTFADLLTDRNDQIDFYFFRLCHITFF